MDVGRVLLPYVGCGIWDVGVGICGSVWGFLVGKGFGKLGCWGFGGLHNIILCKRLRSWVWFRVFRFGGKLGGKVEK